MKTLSKLSFLAFLIVFTFLVSNVNIAIGQVPPPPPGGGSNNGHGLGGNQPASQSAPIGGGLGVLIILGTLYAGKKAFTRNDSIGE
jgi:hypothetical protein